MKACGKSAFKVRSAGSRSPGTPQVVRQCIDQQTAQDLMAKLTGAGGGCQISDLHRAGSRTRWSLNCTGQVDVSGTGEVTMNSNGFNGTLDLMVGMSGQSVPMLQTFDARGGRVQVAAYWINGRVRPQAA